jgi:hypothetical protein
MKVFNELINYTNVISDVIHLLIYREDFYFVDRFRGDWGNVNDNGKYVNSMVIFAIESLAYRQGNSHIW